MRQLTRAEFDALSYRLNNFETALNAFEADVPALGALSGTLDSAIQSLSGTVNARFVSLSGALDSAWQIGDAAVQVSLKTGVTASISSIYTTILGGTSASDAAVQASLQAGASASLAAAYANLQVGVTASIGLIYTTVIAGTSASDAAVQVSLKAGTTASLASQYTMMIAGTTASDNTFYTTVLGGTSASDAAVQVSLKAGATASLNAAYSVLQSGLTSSDNTFYTAILAGTSASDAAVQVSLKAGASASLTQAYSNLQVGVTASIGSIYTTVLAGTSASDAAVQVSLKLGSTASLASQYTMMIAGTTASDNTFYTAILAGTSASDGAIQTSLKAGVTASFGSWTGSTSVIGSITGSGGGRFGHVVATGDVAAGSFTNGNIGIGGNAITNYGGTLYLQYYAPANGVTVGDGATMSSVLVYGMQTITGSRTDANTLLRLRSGSAAAGATFFPKTFLDLEGSEAIYAQFRGATAYGKGLLFGNDSGPVDGYILYDQSADRAITLASQGVIRQKIIGNLTTFNVGVTGIVEATGTFRSTGDIYIAGNPLSGTINAKFVSLAAAGGLINVQKFEYTGSPVTYTKTAGTNKIIVEMVGGGGGGGGGNPVSGNIAWTRGGGSGVYWKKYFGTVSATGSITIGAGGAGGNINIPQIGFDGGSTSFSINTVTYLVLGGLGGSGSAGSNTSAAAPGTMPRYVGSSAGDVVIAKGTVGGHNGFYNGTSQAAVPADAGADSPFGAGGWGETSLFATYGGRGNDGTGNGAGGSGIATIADGYGGGYRWGGSGSHGVCFVYEYA